MPGSFLGMDGVELGQEERGEENLNSAVHAFWLVNTGVISKVLFTSEEPKRNKITSRFAPVIEEEIKMAVFGLLVIQLVWLIY